MTPPINDALRNITSFPDLVKYLCDELEWPIDADDFDSYTFDWDAHEDLGVAPEHAAKIREIKQLRPLSNQQPWGIFFIDFEPKKLPVGVLRRLLNKLVTKQRASANDADRQTWNQDDLLFISSFGETRTEREIAFAHFHHDAGDLPTLRVLGWDGGDTPLKLDQVNRELHTCLRWPDDDADLDEWRSQWSKAFKHRIGHTIQTADMLAKALAELAKNIRDRCQTLLAAEPDNGPLKKLYKAFQAALIHDLTEESFADTYAQTITYGLLTAAISRTDMQGGTDGTFVQADNITDMVPITNPFLKEMLQSFLHAGGRKGGLDFDELGVQDVVELLRGDETDLPSVLRDFGNKNPNEDPVIRFYEDFLTAYNKKLKIQRGVFYTPQPVVSYIVRSVHELLQTEFGLEDGLASTITWGDMIGKNPDIKLPPLTDEPGEKRIISPDEFFVQILDPATGTGTFLVEVIDVIHKHLSSKWKTGGAKAMPQHSSFITHPSSFAAFWNDYVPKALLPRLYAYELMMAPYAIAHMKIGLKLHETGYRFGSDERVRVYLTNALEPKVQQLPQIGFDALAHEAAAVNEIKWYKRFTVVIGNPPYSKSMSKHPWSLGLINQFKVGLSEKKSDLTREEWKFLSYAYFNIKRATVGIAGLVINNAFLSAPTHRGIRRFLLEASSRLEILDLHGDSRKGESSPDGSFDENVFEIQQGVCVTLGTIGTGNHGISTLGKADIYGPKEHKYEQLSLLTTTSTRFERVSPAPPLFFFRGSQSGEASSYDDWIPITEIFVNSNTGIQTKNDDLFADISASALRHRMHDVLENVVKKREVICQKYNLKDSAGWHVSQLDEVEFDDSAVQPFLYKPFDHRFIYYNTRALGRARYSTMRHMLKENLALIATRQVTRLPFCHAFVSRWPIEEKTGSHDRTTQLLPLYIYPEQGQLDFGRKDTPRTISFSPAFTSKLFRTLGVRIAEFGDVPKNGSVSPEEVFFYIYDILHSPDYRERFGHELMGDFPRLPLTSSLDLFREQARLGGELVALHLLEVNVGKASSLSAPVDPTYQQLTEFTGENRTVGKVGFTVGRVSSHGDPIPPADDSGPTIGTVWIDGGGTKKSFAAGTSGFIGVPEAVWNFHIGGYQVCEKWLKDRKGRELTDDDIAHYHKIVIALSETIRLMAEIDEVIDSHGGWPGAFVKGATEE
jgi:predicted helicase